jgi:hypothetical protein
MAAPTGIELQAKCGQMNRPLVHIQGLNYRIVFAAAGWRNGEKHDHRNKRTSHNSRNKRNSHNSRTSYDLSTDYLEASRILGREGLCGCSAL